AKALADEGVEDAYKVTKQLREAQKAGKLDETVRSIEEMVNDPRVKQFEEINQPKPEAEIPYRLDERGKPIVRVPAEGRDVNVTQNAEIKSTGPSQNLTSETGSGVSAEQVGTQPNKPGTGGLFESGEEALWRNGDVDEPVKIT